MVSLFSCALKHEKVDEVIDFCHGLIWVKFYFHKPDVHSLYDMDSVYQWPT